MKTIAALACAALLLLTVPAASAQSVLNRDHVWGAGASFNFPYDEFGNDAGTGWGLFGTLDFPLIPLFDLTGRVGWNTFPGNDHHEAVDVWEVTAGGRLSLGTFFMSGEVGWYDKGDTWSWVPGLGLRFTNLEVALRWRAVGRNAFTGASAAWYF